MCLVVLILNNTRTEAHTATERASGGRRPLLILGWASFPREHIAQTREKTKIGAFLFFLGEKSGARHGGGGVGRRCSPLWEFMLTRNLVTRPYLEV